MSGPSRLAALLAVAALLLLPGGAAAQTATTAPPTTTQPEITAAQAGPGVLLDAADRVELAQSLAEATEESEICFGYVAQLDNAGAVSQDVVSSAGPNVRAATGPSCPKGAVELQVRLEYSCSSCESSDEASWSVVSNVAGVPPSTIKRRLEDLTGLGGGDLLGDKDDQALRNAAAALPLAVDGAVVEPAAPSADSAAPNGDRLTGSPGSDWLRENWLRVGIGVVLLLIALPFLLVGIGLLVARRRRARRAAGGTDPPPADDPPSDDPRPTSS